MPPAFAVRPRRPGPGRRLRLEPFEDRLAPAVVSFHLSSDWGTGFTAALRIANDKAAPINGWRLEFDFPYQITQLWSGVIAGHTGNHYVVDDAGYNRTIAPGQAVEFGFSGTPGHVSGHPTNYRLNGVSLAGGSPRTVSVAGTSVTEGDSTPVTANFAVTLSAPSVAPVTVQYATADVVALAGTDYVATSGTLTFQPGETRKTIPVMVLGDRIDEANEKFTLNLSNSRGATLGTARAVGTIVDNDPTPALSVSEVTVAEPTGNPMAPGFLQTRGNQIVDAAGRPVRLSGVSWFGMESSTFAPQGLWVRSYQSMMDQMRDLGFNCIRLPFSDQLFDPGSTPNGIDFGLNPDLQGLTGVQIMDKIVDYAGQIGLRVILDHHRSEAGDGAEANGLWYTSAYPESRWIADWRMLAQRYAGNPTVIGADLHNEPHDPATWGDGSATDWRLAAERAGNAVLAVNPHWLVIVEGVQTTAAGSTWWGGNLSNAGAFPVRLAVPDRLVYSPHDYPASIYPQSWFSDPSYPHNLYAIWDRYWGYLFRQNTAPVLLGEFGSKLETTSDQQWMAAITTYLGGDLAGNGTNDLGPGQQGPSWMWWSWNPNSGDTGGILQDDWVDVQQAKVDLLKPVEFAMAGPASADFTVSLNVPSGRTVLVNYATINGTATAGTDYIAVSGTLTFQPGETTKTVSVPILADNLADPPETFTLRLSNPRFASLADPVGIGTTLDAGTAPPTVGTGDVRVEYNDRDDWGTGFVADTTITNNGTTAITGWTLEFDFDREITNIWNAQIVSHVGSRFVIRNLSWNPVIAANGGTVDFGFQGAPGNAADGPRNYVLNGVAVP